LQKIDADFVLEKACFDGGWDPGLVVEGDEEGCGVDVMPDTMSKRVGGYEVEWGLT
jgi:hypothetical protein